jgi:hypothetical protein
MKVLLCTENPRKDDEYRRHFALYGLSKSLESGGPTDEAGIIQWLEAAGTGSFVLREISDIYFPDETPVPAPYRIEANDGLEVFNVSTAFVHSLGEAGQLKVAYYNRSIPGRLRIVEESEDVFDWDDVFVPDRASESYHEAKAGPGKMSARSLVLDAVVQDFLPFRSSRAFKYGKLNENGMVDLNHWLIEPAAAIQFEKLPWDFFATGPLAGMETLEKYGIASMLRSALADGAHFRAARSRREWIYWAPGINAGIPLTPKEDPSAELVYLVHDFAHYLLPDLLIDVPSSPAADMALVVHRMIGETLAMTMADMFFMDARARTDPTADAGKHGIHAIFAMADLDDVPENEAFFVVLRAAAAALLLEDASKLVDLLGASDEAATVIGRFMAKYRKFALADYEWTHLNLQQFRLHEGRMRRWLDLMPEGHLEAAGLDTASAFLGRLGPGIQGATPAEILRMALDDVVDRNLRPRMTAGDDRGRDEILTRSLKRYLTGQMAIHARYPDMESSLNSLPVILDALKASNLDLADEARVRASIEEDLVFLEKRYAITPLDREIYASVYPIVDARYVSYAAPNFGGYNEAFRAIMGESA